MTLKQGQVRIVKSVPIFHDWSFECGLEYDDTVIDSDSMHNIINHLARYGGLVTSGQPLAAQLWRSANEQRPHYAELEALGLLEYGSVIHGDLVRDILGLEMPQYGTKKQSDEVTLQELGAPTTCVISCSARAGIWRAPSDYRVLLPSRGQTTG